MRSLLRYVRFPAGSYLTSAADSVFHALKDSDGLRRVSFDHSIVCRSVVAPGAVSTERLAHEISFLLATLQRKHKRANTYFDILDLVRVEWRGCDYCMRNGPPTFDRHGRMIFHVPGGGCSVECNKLEAHSKREERKLRAAIAWELRVQE